MMCPPLVVKGKKHAVEAGVRCKKRMQTEFRTSGSLSALPTINSKTWATPPPNQVGARDFLTSRSVQSDRKPYGSCGCRNPPDSPRQA